MSRGETFKLIVGLGNPGAEYKDTRHNIGFMVIDELLQKLPGRFEEVNKFESLFWKGRSRGGNLFLQKPMTFMNLSGKAVSKLMNSFKIKPQEVLVVFDDLDLPFGKLRIRKGGGTGGHNGVDSIIKEIGSADFVRLRVGIGRKEKASQADHVLGVFDEDEKVHLPLLLDIASDAAKLVLYRGTGTAMNQYNGFEISNYNKQ